MIKISYNTILRTHKDIGSNMYQYQQQFVDLGIGIVWVLIGILCIILSLVAYGIYTHKKSRTRKFVALLLTMPLVWLVIYALIKGSPLGRGFMIFILAIVGIWVGFKLVVKLCRRLLHRVLIPYFGDGWAHLVLFGTIVAIIILLIVIF